MTTPAHPGEPQPSDDMWQPYVQRAPLRVVEHDGDLELCDEGGAYFVRRPIGGGKYEETERMREALARVVWERLRYEQRFGTKPPGAGIHDCPDTPAGPVVPRPRKGGAGPPRP